jgi:para-aminobenzoate synthetase
VNVVIVDNHDSFTFNLFDLVGQVAGSPPTVVTNDGVSLEHLRRMAPEAVVISPGPGHPGRPRDFGVCTEVITGLGVPVLGVCLGHQGIAHAFGATVAHAPEPMHGRVSAVFHDGLDIFEGIPSGFRAVRYHSLVVTGRVPDELIVNAWTADGVPMAVRHRSLPLRGVQFHPESILSEHGHRLVRNFLDLAAPSRRPATVPSANGSASPAPRPARTDGRWRSRARRLPFWVEPEAVFCASYGEARHAFWLDSSLVQPGSSRFSFMGAADGPEGSVVTHDSDDSQEGPGSVFEVLEQVLAERQCPPPADLPFDFNGGLVGWFGHELKSECGFTARHRSPLPDAAFLFADRILAFDHMERAVYLVALETEAGAADTDRWFAATERDLRFVPSPPPIHPRPGIGHLTISPRRHGEGYLSDIRRCLDQIRDGESYEICLTNTFATDPVDRPLDLYRIMRRVSPAPYAAFLRFDDVTVLSSSPERFLRVGREGSVSSKPVKGTAARAADGAEDERARRLLAGSVKDAAENLMIVDLVRNDLSRVCEIGTVSVPKLMDVESYGAVHQLVSTVSGRRRAGVTAIDCVRAAFPPGSMTGAPKARTIEILDRLEGGARGIYSGSIGWLGASGAADLNVVIRTAVVTPNETSFGVGGAIVALSDPAREFEECVLKGAAIIRSLLLLHGSPLRPGFSGMEAMTESTVGHLLDARAPAISRARGTGSGQSQNGVQVTGMDTDGGERAVGEVPDVSADVVGEQT